MRLNKKQIIVMWIGLSLLLPVCAYLYILINDFQKNVKMEPFYQQEIDNINTSYNKSIDEVNTSLRALFKTEEERISAIQELLKGQCELTSKIYDELNKKGEENKKIRYKLIFIFSGIITYVSILFACLLYTNLVKK